MLDARATAELEAPALLLCVLKQRDKALVLKTGSARPAAQPVGIAVMMLRLNRGAEVRGSSGGGGGKYRSKACERQIAHAECWQKQCHQ